MLAVLDKGNSIIVGYDFDDTVSVGNFGYAKEYIEIVHRLLRDLNDTGKFRFILITCRENDQLREAEKFLEKHKLPYNALNHNLANSLPDNPRKIYCNIMLDDKCGLPISITILNNLLKHIHEQNFQHFSYSSTSSY